MAKDNGDLVWYPGTRNGEWVAVCISLSMKRIIGTAFTDNHGFFSRGTDQQILLCGVSKKEAIASVEAQVPKRRVK